MRYVFVYSLTSYAIACFFIKGEENNKHILQTKPPKINMNTYYLLIAAQ